MRLRTIFLLALAVAAGLLVPFAPAGAQEPVAAGAISGTVTVDGRPAAGIGVVVSRAMTGMATPVAKVSTDAEGRYVAERLAAGQHLVVAHAPALVVDGARPHDFGGRSITLGEGERADGVDLKLVRGGVITGRVTTADGRPAVGEEVDLHLELAANGSYLEVKPRYVATDDRGVYRAYGLIPGRYKVSVGRPDSTDSVHVGTSRMVYPRSFYPRGADESGAEVLDVTSGREIPGIDIVLEWPQRVYSIAGRAVYSDTGAPAAGVMVFYAPYDGDRISGARGSPGPASPGGEFRLSGLRPGAYSVSAASEGTDYYGESVRVEIVDANITGLTVSLKRGGSIAGVLVLEGAPHELPALGELSVRAILHDQRGMAIGAAGARVGPDGTFLVTGLAPGEYDFVLGPWDQPRQPKLVRIEHLGAQSTKTVKISGTERLEGVRLVALYGSATISGTVKVSGPYAGLRQQVSVQFVHHGTSYRESAQVDERGQFATTSLMAGDYEVSVVASIDDGGATRTFESKGTTVRVDEGQVRELNLELETIDENEVHHVAP